MLVRVRDFGDSYGHLFPESSVARQKFAEVATAVTQLDAHALTHMTASVAATGKGKAKARKALADALQAISHTASVLAEELPALDEHFRLPKPATDQESLIAGRKFARDVEPFKSHFIAHGMATTFVADLDALVDGFERALRERGMGRDERLAANASIKAALSSGQAAVRALDVIVANHLHDAEVTRTVWDRDRRIVYPGAHSTAATPEPAPTADAPVSVAPATPAPSNQAA
jgi:hypothetical protein